MNYSKQLLTELNNQMPKEILDFYNDYADKFGWGGRDFKEFLVDTINSHFKDTDHISVSERTAALRKYFKSYKYKLLKLFTEHYSMYDIVDSKHPFHYVYQKYEVLSASEWKQLYGDCTLEEYCQKLYDAVMEWKSNSDNMFIKFPALLNYNAHIYVKYLKLDIALVICTIVQSQFDGSFDNYFRRYPTILIDKPLFGPTAVEIVLNNVANMLSSEYLITSDGSTRLRTTLLGFNDENTSLIKGKSWDAKSFKIFDYILSNLTEDFLINRTIIIDTFKLAKLFFPKPSAAQYTKVEEYCKELGMYSFSLSVMGTNDVVMNLFDLVTPIIDASGKRVVVFHASISLYTAIIKNRMTYVTTHSFNALEDEMSKIIYFALQRERISFTIQALKRGDSFETMSLKTVYKFSFFRSVVHFKYKQITKNVALIVRSLDEFVKKHIAIKSYRVLPDNCIEVEYIPLSQDEYDDLSFKPYLLSTIDDEQIIEIEQVEENSYFIEESPVLL